MHPQIARFASGVVFAPSPLTYEANPATYVRNQTIAPNHATNKGGAPTRYTMLAQPEFGVYVLIPDA